MCSLAASQGLLLPVWMSSQLHHLLWRTTCFTGRKEKQAGRRGCDSDLSEETEWRNPGCQSGYRSGRGSIWMWLLSCSFSKPPHRQVIGCMGCTGLSRFPSKSNRLIRHGDRGCHRHGPLCGNLHGGAYQDSQTGVNAWAWKCRGTATLDGHRIRMGLVLCAV
jgi:hypothetical protein